MVAVADAKTFFILSLSFSSVNSIHLPHLPHLPPKMKKNTDFANFVFYLYLDIYFMENLWENK
jgi:hypothetical protein